MAITVQLPDGAAQTKQLDDWVDELLGSYDFHFGGGREALLKGTMEKVYSDLGGEYNVMVFNMEQAYDFRVSSTYVFSRQSVKVSSIQETTMQYLQ
jgi:hypothetical protein